jgi:pseudouridylate synthase / pseudouridine kinase
MPLDSYVSWLEIPLISDANCSLHLKSGIAIFNPIPEEHAIPKVEMEIVIEAAIEDCKRQGITGKDITPFLLQRVVEATKGRSLSANIALIKNNARVGAEIAVSLASLENSSQFQPQDIESLDGTALPDNAAPSNTPAEAHADILVIGSMAVDLTCTLPNVSSDSLQLHTSHPAKIHTSAGGVAHNVALAASYASSNSVRLVTALGSDPEGAWLREYAQNAGLDVGFISGGTGTARYVAIHDKQGELVTAAADMRIIERLHDSDLQREIHRAKPKWMAIDGNLSSSSIKTILDKCKSDVIKGTLLFGFPAD